MPRSGTALFALMLTLAACDRSRENAQPEPKPLELSQAATREIPKAPTFSSRISRPAVETLVAIGDLHGDLNATRNALRLAGAIDERDHWVGGKLMVVQTGDVIDRGDQDREVLDLLERLKTEAKQAGGEFVALSGNHELMNVALDFRYVSPASFAAFSGQAGRVEAFHPGGAYAAMLSERPIVMKVGDTLFVHGGVLMKHVSYGLERMNDEVHAWMRATRRGFPEAVMAEDGPVWTRVYSAPPEDCQQLAQVLDVLGVKRMVVGHTVQPNGINAACDGRIWRIDVGLSRYYGGPMQVLEIKNGEPRVKAAP